MSATLIEALIGQAGDDPAIDRATFRACVQLFDTGDLTANNIAAALNLTSTQRTELDEILATRPGGLAALLTRAQWVHKVDSVIVLASLGSYAGYMTPADVRGQLGIN